MIFNSGPCWLSQSLTASNCLVVTSKWLINSSTAATTDFEPTILANLSTPSPTILIKSSAIYGHYELPLDRESAYEVLTRRASQAEAAAEQAKTQSELQKIETQQAKERAKREAELAKDGW